MGRPYVQHSHRTMCQMPKQCHSLHTTAAAAAAAAGTAAAAAAAAGTAAYNIAAAPPPLLSSCYQCMLCSSERLKLG